ASANGSDQLSKYSLAVKQSSTRRRSTSTTAPTEPRASSSHMNQNRSCPGVPNRYSTRSSMEMRPKSIATVVVVLPGTALTSSSPTEAVVSASSVTSGGISDR